jgi:thiol-disulfide isomerase/thioredoxin
MRDGVNGDGVEAMMPSPATSAPARVVFAEAPWCVECRRMAPLVEDVAAARAGVVLERVDVSGDGAAEDLGVLATPTLIGFAGDAEVARVAGRRGRTEIEGFFAAMESGIRPPQTSGTEIALRVGAGAMLVVSGMFAGPSWPLIGFGAVVGGYGLLGLRPTRR